MKKLICILTILIVSLGIVACDDTTTSESTTFVSTSSADGDSSGTTASNPTDESGDSSSELSNTSTTVPTNSEVTTAPNTQDNNGITEESNGDIQAPDVETEGSSPQGNPSAPSTPDNSGSPDQSGNSNSSTTTAHNHNTTTGQPITSTVNKTTSTSSGKGTSAKTTTTTKATTKPTTTTTTKKTSTKKVTTTVQSNTVKNHTFSNASYTKVDMNTHKATGKCSVCGVSATQAEAHKWGSWVYDTYPTSTEEGIKYRTCTGCKEEQVTLVPKTSANTSNFAKEAFDLINAERAKKGLPAYSYYTAGQNAANTRAKELMTYFSHTRPDGSKWYTVVGLGDSCKMGAENIARGCASPEDIVAAFMGASDNRANILSTKYTHVVIGYYEDAWVQIFLKP